MSKIYFAGTNTKEVEQYLEDNNVNRLLSYYNDKKLVKDKTERGFKIFLDSGAFTAWTKGVEIDEEEYMDFVKEYNDGIEYYMQLDKIPGKFGTGKKPTNEELEHAQEETWRNYLHMRDNVVNPEKLVPVFHYGSNIKYFKKLLNDPPECGIVAIGALVGVNKMNRKIFFDDLFSIIGDMDIKIHALGMTDLELLGIYPIYSADSSRWIRTATSGVIFTEYCEVAISKETVKHPHNYKHMHEDMKQLIREEVEENGFTIEQLEESSYDRLKYNVKYFLEWEANDERNNQRNEDWKVRTVQSKLF